MHLQSLELVGFKSFADKTVFEFHEGVTAIVGPNGCGKSNVLDAVRWALGEQSAKALRGGEMADVIFNGTDTRKPVGVGEVSLTFSDCATELGIDWHEVRVTRRVYRDGNSEYLLNKTLCRLKDIQSLFAGTGVGRSAYSLMEQGKIDLILSSRPEDRRAVFEEAAGITKYKTQKKEALRKLEATEANLLRIGDIIKEVKRQIGSLQRQAGKARRYQALLADLRVLDTHHSRRQLDDLERQLEECRDEIARFEEAEASTLGGIEANENELAVRRGELDEIDGRIGDARADVQRLQNEISTHRHRIEFNRQRADEVSELMERYRNDIDAAETKRGEQESQIREADVLIEKTNRLLATKENELQELTEKAARLKGERAARETELQTLQLALSKMENRLAAFEEELPGTKARREATLGRIEELGAGIANATETREQAKAGLETARAAAEAGEQTIEQLFARAETAERQWQDHQKTLAGSEKALGLLERAIADKGSRLEILRQLNEEGEGLAAGSQAVLKGLEDPDRIRPALAGALVSNMNVEREYIAALEAAFGRSIHAVVLRDTNLVSEIVSRLRQKNLGQAALAIPALADEAAGPEPPNLPQGALAWAADKMDAPESLRPLVRRLLRDVVIVRDLDAALKLKERVRHFAIATLAGEFISLEGIVFGGSSNGQADSLLERKARVGILAAEQSALVAERDTLQKECDEAKSRLESAAEQRDAARAQHQAAQLARTASGSEMLLAERELAEAERKLAGLHTEKTTLEQQVHATDERVAALEQELAALRDVFSQQEAERGAAQSAQENARQGEEEATGMLQEMRLAVATERQRHESLVSQRQPMTVREVELAELIATRRRDIATYESRLALQAEESRAADAAIEAQSAECTAAEAAVAEIARERSSRLTAITELEAALRSARNSLNELHDRRGQQQVLQTQMQMRSEHLSENVARRYDVDLRAFSPDAYAFQKTFNSILKGRDKSERDPVVAASGEAGDSQLEQIIAELTRQLDQMGPVNLDAVHEYDELEERHQFLETQNSDLTAARREVLDVIARINQTTQKLFAETFAQVRINFREMFCELFGGGRADLSLQDENDPLNCGIEITAKPPGKQLQSVSLLSGGERTMTAVALLFAIYMVRPSPFCILDEMDAPLDESNINRFIKVLERFVSQSQFIIITHNKRTIAKADVLYGVTMEERGVSKLVGMRLASEKGSDGVLKAPRRAAAPPQFPQEGVEHERELALSR